MFSDNRFFKRLIVKQRSSVILNAELIYGHLRQPLILHSDVFFFIYTNCILQARLIKNIKYSCTEKPLIIVCFKQKSAEIKNLLCISLEFNYTMWYNIGMM